MKNEEQRKMDYETAMLILKDYSDVISESKSKFKPISLLSNSIEEIKSAIISNVIVCKIREIKNIPFSKDEMELYELMKFSFTSLADFVEDFKVKRLNDYLDFMENLENFPYPENPSEEEKIENRNRLSSHPGHKDYAEYLQIFYKFEDEFAELKVNWDNKDLKKSIESLIKLLDPTKFE